MDVKRGRGRPTSRTRDEVSAAVAALRGALGETQQQFAARLGSGITTVARWETTRQPETGMLVRLMQLADAEGQPDLAGLFQLTLTDRLGVTVPRA